MPTIELVSIDCSIIPELPKYPNFSYMMEPTLESHRDLFQSVFNSLSGIIIHLGNKELEEREHGFWFAGMLMDWDYDEALVFSPEVFQDVIALMQKLIVLSPQQRITSSSDYQFGGLRQECGEVTFSQFLQLHEQKKLRYNNLWYVCSDN